MINDEHSVTMEMVAATLAHEVKNPLSLIKANIDYIELCDTEKIHGECYAIMKKELIKANDILMSFIEYVKPNVGLTQKIDILNTLNETVLNYKNSTHSNIKFIKNDLTNNAYILSDLNSIRILFNNIIKNAIESVNENPKEKPKIIKIYYTIKNNFITINFEDNGHGLSEKNIECINNNLCYTTKKDGSGLGISICKKIVLNHNGTYEIQNLPQGGCLVKICLPII